MSTVEEHDNVWVALQQALSHSDDVEHRTLKSNHKQAEIFYLKSVCDNKIVTHHIVRPFWELQNAEEYTRYLDSFPGSKHMQDLSDGCQSLLRGSVAILLQDEVYLFPANKREASPVGESSVETIVQGPQDSFNEQLSTNLNLIRQRYQTVSLQVETHEIGHKSRTKVAVVYDQSCVNQDALIILRARLSSLDTDLLLSVGQLQRHMSPSKWNPFPTMVSTERPDRVVKSLGEGKIAVLVDNTPFALIAPSIFSDFFTSMDDIYQLPTIGKFLIILRYMGLALTITLPAFYVGTVSYNPEFFRVQLALSIAGSRAAVPYPSYLEVLFMLVMMEFLTEASIRLPKAIGPTATTVGGLILGQAATEAALASNIMIIIVAAVAISNFVIPINTMSFAIRVLKYIFLIFATLFGLIGIATGIFVLVFYLANITSFGTPYIQLFRKEAKRS